MSQRSPSSSMRLSLLGKRSRLDGVDQPGGSAALLLGLLWERDQRVLYIPGLSVNRASDSYPEASPKPMPAMPASSPIRLV